MNAYLCRHHEEDFRTEKLRREGRAQFGTACYGCTVDVLAAYHHVHVRPESIPDSAFEWQGHFYSFWWSYSAWPQLRGLFTAVVGRTIRFRRCGGFQVLPYLDCLILAATVAATTAMEAKPWARCFSASSSCSAGSSTRPSA